LAGGAAARESAFAHGGLRRTRPPNKGWWVGRNGGTEIRRLRGWWVGWNLHPQPLPPIERTEIAQQEEGAPEKAARKSADYGCFGFGGRGTLAESIMGSVTRSLRE